MGRLPRDSRSPEDGPARSPTSRLLHSTMHSSSRWNQKGPEGGLPSPRNPVEGPGKSPSLRRQSLCLMSRQAQQWIAIALLSRHPNEGPDAPARHLSWKKLSLHVTKLREEGMELVMRQGLAQAANGDPDARARY